MKKKLFSTMLLMLMVLALMVFTVGCKSEGTGADAARIAQLEQENAELKAQLEELTAGMDRENDRLQQLQTDVLQDWSLDVQAWSDGNGATVTFSASPVSYVDGQKAALSVRMGDLEAESTNCVWDGTAFTGSVELSAADGYSYYCVLTNVDGSQAEVELNSPENITNETLVNLGSNLSAYANLVVEDWSAAATSLNIHSGFAQVQMPRLTFNNMTASISSADLVLKLNSEEVSRQSLTLSAGEDENGYEAVISSCSFTMPAMEDDYQLDLWLEVSLNTGSTISVSGGSWYSSNGELQLVVG